jgi:hypothetical protein
LRKQKPARVFTFSRSRYASSASASSIVTAALAPRNDSVAATPLLVSLA